MGKQKKHYYLWLDESGSFEEDPGDKKAPPSLVGGVFCEEAVYRRVRPRDILKQIAERPDFLAASGGIPLPVDHCTELPGDVKVPARMQVIQWCVEQGMGFVFLRNSAKVRIVDPTKTYLNFLAEGLAQFMAHLSYRGSSHLTIIIGRRLDAGKQSIDQREYDRIAERVAIAKVKHLFDGMDQITYETRFDSDKKNEFLVLSDYVCSCRYTLDLTAKDDRRTWESYEEQEGGLSRRAVLEELFRAKSKTFGLLEDQIQNDVRRSMDHRDWGGALFLALSEGTPTHSIEDELLETFQRFDSQDQRTQMMMFFHLVGHLLHIRGSSEDAIGLLKAYLAFLDRLPMCSESLRSYCSVNARLYLTTAYTHCGRSGAAKEQLDQCEDALPALLRQPENLDLYYILRNRQAVVWQDCFCYDKALAVLKDARAAADLQQEYQQELLGQLGYASGYQVSEQLAKLLGTLALTYQFILPAHPELAKDAKAAAGQAIEAMRSPEDKRRHYMTLAEIELCCGELDEAYRHFCAGLGCEPDSMLETLEQSDYPYDWYHAIRLTDGLCRGSREQREQAETLFGLIQDRFETVFGKKYPAHSAARRAGMLCLKMGKGRAKLAQRYFQKCESMCLRDGEDTLCGIGLACLASRIAADLGYGKRVEQLEHKFREHCARAERRVQIPELRVFFHELACASEASGDKKGFYQSVSDRVGH